MLFLAVNMLFCVVFFFTVNMVLWLMFFFTVSMIFRLVIVITRMNCSIRMAARTSSIRKPLRMRNPYIFRWLSGVASAGS